MRTVKRIVSTSFWEDETVVNEFSPEDKYFYLYLLTNPHTTQLGIYKFVPKIAAFETGYSVSSILVLLERFEKKYDMIRFSSKTSEIAIKNYLRHSVMKGGKPVTDCLIKEESEVVDKSLLIYVYEHLRNVDNLNITVNEYISSLKDKYDNDNDNERIVNESYHESSVGSSAKRFVPPSVDEVRLYCINNDKLYVNPDAFVDFYESKNWYVGKNKMTNWHKAASGWNTRAKERGEKQHLFLDSEVANGSKEGGYVDY